MACIMLSEPVPPCISGAASAAHSSSPVPCGPKSALCPGMATNAAPRRATSTSSTPADCDASTMNGTEYFRHSAPISYTGSTKPNTFETCVHTASDAPLSLSSKSFNTSSLSKSLVPAMRTSAPSAASGLVTELCSNPLMTTLPPLLASELMAMFSACVAFIVKTTFVLSSTLNSSAAASRQLYTVSAASRAGLCPPLPGLAMLRMAVTTARSTHAGFIRLVAALSRYIITSPRHTRPRQYF